jgi:hypothetical protein
MQNMRGCIVSRFFEGKKDGRGAKRVPKIKRAVKAIVIHKPESVFFFGFMRFKNSQTGRAVRPPIIPAR